jgi:hypothetical protein
MFSPTPSPFKASFTDHGAPRRGSDLLEAFV